MPDNDGYPTEAELAQIQTWSASLSGWFDLIKSCWWAADWGWTQFEGQDDGRPCTVYQISTGGWSGNEAIIGAMRENFVMWAQTWHSHRRGGHYELRALREGHDTSQA